MSQKRIASLVVCAGLGVLMATKLAGTPQIADANPQTAVTVATPVAAARNPAATPVVKPVVDDRFSMLRGREGYWRIAKTRDGVWWFLSPQNQTEFLNGVTTVQPTLASYQASGPAYLSSDWDRSPATLSRWADLTVARVQAIGFKNLGAWCNPVLHQFSLPMT